MRPRPAVEADADPSDSRLLDHLIAEAVPDMASFLQGKFRLAADPGDEVIACSALFEPARFDGLIARLSESYPGADRRAVVSMWTLYYFSMLSIAPIVLWRRTNRILPLDLETTSVVVSKSSGLPEAFVLTSAGRTEAALPVSRALDAMIGRHMAPAIAFLVRHCRISARLLWCNAAGYMDWILRELTSVDGEDQGLDLFGERTLASGAPNPFFGLIARVTDPEDPTGEVSRRKVCCLRYVLPGVGGCGAVCPLRDGRR